MISIISDSEMTIKNIKKVNDNACQSFRFHKIFDDKVGQVDVFDYVKEKCVSKLIEGRNGCVFCYGMNGSGKTHTINGGQNKKNAISFDSKDPRGLIPLTIEFLFEQHNKMKDTREFIITCSYYEIYLNKVRDLGRDYESEYERKCKIFKIFNLIYYSQRFLRKE